MRSILLTLRSVQPPGGSMGGTDNSPPLSSLRSAERRKTDVLVQNLDLGETAPSWPIADDASGAVPIRPGRNHTMTLRE